VVLDSALATGARLSHYDPNHKPDYDRIAEYHKRKRANEVFVAETKPLEVSAREEAIRRYRAALQTTREIETFSTEHKLFPSWPDGGAQEKDVRILNRLTICLIKAGRAVVTTKNREWLFQRNSVDSRRVSATITEHPEKAVVEYAESDVRNLLGINGWAEVLKLTSTDADKAGITIVSATAGVDEGLLRPSHVRFPGYKLFDVADWLEGK
jgi:hypothetical protein